MAWQTATALLLLLAACTCTSGRDRTRPSVEDLSRLRREMSIDDVKRILGEPKQDLGSGLFVFVYELADGSTAMVGSDGTRVLYVRHGEQDLLK